MNQAKDTDGISAKFIKILSEIIDYCITNIINQNISNNDYSKNCKTAIVKPIFKKGDINIKRFLRKLKEKNYLNLSKSYKFNHVLINFIIK